MSELITVCSKYLEGLDTENPHSITGIEPRLSQNVIETIFFSCYQQFKSLECARANPEKARTGFCFLEREMALRNRRKTDPVVFSGLFFFGYFLLEEQKKVT